MDVNQFVSKKLKYVDPGIKEYTIKHINFDEEGIVEQMADFFG